VEITRRVAGFSRTAAVGNHSQLTGANVEKTGVFAGMSGLAGLHRQSPGSNSEVRTDSRFGKIAFHSVDRKKLEQTKRRAFLWVFAFG